MLRHILTLLSLLILTQTLYGLENTTCKQCHPLIYNEYRNSIHAKASIFNDPVHKAVWDKHPAKNKGNYKCAKCHTPADHTLIAQKGLPYPNSVQMNEPISCQSCHAIKRIEEHTKANKNIYTAKKKYFYAANRTKKGEKVIFKEKKQLFGLLTETSGSPYHDIDYGNEGFYNGKMCLGCHDHKRNGKGFAVCDMQIKLKGSKKSCITCHMPQIQGPFVNLHHTQTHAFHGITIHQKPLNLSKYIKLSMIRHKDVFSVLLKNEATHTLFPQPLRLAQLRVSIEQQDKEISLPVVNFKRIIGTDGKPSMPWVATEVLSDNTIKALETRKISFQHPLHKGDVVIARFGYYIADPKAARKLGIDTPEAVRFITLTESRFSVP